MKRYVVLCAVLALAGCNPPPLDPVAVSGPVDRPVEDTTVRVAALDDDPVPLPTTTVPPTTTTHAHPTTTTTAPVVPATVAPPVTYTASSGGVWEHLARIRQCESGGNYQAVNPTGKFRGAYQFSRSTFDWVARSAGRPDLVGVDPAAASHGDQDAMAHWLYVNDGPQHWPECRYA